ncbi:MAG: hypothetical protein COA78_34730 [Blastopirellula sp.]|nr:MAG: hypothetical protein COA78_34730 [Blastopirellula sp.]
MTKISGSITIRIASYLLVLIPMLCCTTLFAGDQKLVVFSKSFLAELPRRKATEVEIAQEYMKEIQKIDYAKDRIDAIQWIQDLKGHGYDDILSQIMKELIDKIDVEELIRLSSTIARFPELYEQVFQRYHANQREMLLDLYCMSSYNTEFSLEVILKMEPSERKALAIYRAALRAESLDHSMKFVELAQTIPSEHVSYYATPPSFIARNATDNPQLACDFIERLEHQEKWAGIYFSFAQFAKLKKPSEVEFFTKKAWSNLPHSESPYSLVTRILKESPEKYSREQWIEFYREWVIPPITDQVVGINLLGNLVLVDTDLMLELTKEACKDELLSLEDQLPSVVGFAIYLEPQAILNWLQDIEIPARDHCILKLSNRNQFVSNFRQKSPDYQKMIFDRIVQLARNMQAKDLQRKAYAELLRVGKEFGFYVPKEIYTECEQVVKDMISSKEFDPQNRATWDYFQLASPEMQRPILQKMLREIPTNQEQPRYVILANLVHTSNLPNNEKMSYYRALFRDAEKHKDSFSRTKIAVRATEIDFEWGIKSIWSILPEDRGASGKKTYFDWIPPPYDAGDAIDWLTRDLSTNRRSPLFEELWKFHPTAPPQDQDRILRGIIERLAHAQHLDIALGLADKIKHPQERAKALMAILRNHHHVDHR